MQRQLFIMVKEPRPGRVKTRLGATLGMTTAAWWFRHQAQGLIRRVGRDPRWCCRLAVAPDMAGMASRVWPANLMRHPQGQGDLGDRMRGIFRTAHPGPCLIIGADIPNVGRTHIWQAFEALKHNDAVIGPATDGGYWLIGWRKGTRKTPNEMFSGVRWSTQYAREDTVNSLPGIRIGYAATMSDVDTQADLKAVNP